MTITITSTDRIVQVQAGPGAPVPGRVWEGKTESGIEVFCVVTRVAVQKDADCSQFERELTEHQPPTSTAIEAIPLRMIL